MKRRGTFLNPATISRNSMEQREFDAFVVAERDGAFTGTVIKKRIADLPRHGLLVRVRYSSLNFKDALSASGNRGVSRRYPHTPGIDAVGTVVASDSEKFHENDTVIITGYDLGMNTSGGFAEYIRVPPEWAVALPEGLTMRESMILGTAGLTSALSVLRLTESVRPEEGKIVVSGATGGVGSIAVALLAGLGYRVAAMTGKEQEGDYLLGLGASEILMRRDYEAETGSALLDGEFAGAVDSVGGHILGNIIKSMQPMGVVTCCGNAASPKLDITVYPFILRGVSLIGIDSQNCPLALREKVWKKLSGRWKPEGLEKLCTEIPLGDLPSRIELMLQGKLKGRTVVNTG